MKKLVLSTIFSLLCIYSLAGENRHVFQKALESVPVEYIRADGWCPYPDYSDRAAWDAFLKDRKDAVIKKGEQYLDYQWQLIMATDYLAFERTGDRLAMQNPLFDNMGALSALTIAELAEGQGRFIDQIINGLFLQAERTSWCWSGHEYRKASGRSLPDYRDIFIDLGAQHVALQVAIDYYFFKDVFNSIDPSINATIQHALKEKIFDPYLDSEKWKSQSWLGYAPEGEKKPFQWESWDPVNNWNTWCNNMIVNTCLYAQEDKDLLMKELRQAAESLDIYLANVDIDGGCDEGSAYWSHVGGELISYIIAMNDATGGRFGCFDDPQVRAMGYYNSRMYAGDGWTINFCDCNARAAGEYDVLYLYGSMCGLEEVTDFAMLLNSYSDNPGKNNTEHTSYIHGLMENFRFADAFEAQYEKVLKAASGDIAVMRRNLRARVPSATWYSGIGHVVYRNRQGLVLGAKAGHNAESHNHNDVGSFVLYKDGMPMLVDVGNCTYMRQTFNKKERYTIWSMRSEWHNLPVMNGRPQHDGREYASAWSKSDAAKNTFSAEIAGAYEAEARCRSLVRTLSLAGNTLTITDRFELMDRTAPDEEHFMVRGEVEDLGNGKLKITCHDRNLSRSGTAIMTYSKGLSPIIETKVLTDPVHTGTWGNDLKRIILRSSDDAPLKGIYKVQITII